MAHSFSTREQWLEFLTEGLRPYYKEHGYPIPAKVRFAVGFTSAGYRSKAIGECWDSSVSADKTSEIFIKPDQDDQDRVAGILAHELIHAAVGVREGHKGAFKQAMRAMGFTGKPTATLPGPEMMRDVVSPLLRRAGPLPHRMLKAYKRAKKQKTRLLKAECPVCGYVVRVTQKWLDDAGAPHCGRVKHGRMVCDVPEGEEGED